MRRVLVAVAALLAAAGAQALDNPFPKAGAAYLVVRDGQPLWGQAVERRLQPASLAKMMTALLAVESGKAPDRIVVVGAGAARATGKRLGLRAGERLRASDLLAASMIASTNDACRALAEDLGGTRERFTAAMNARAVALGMQDTRFADPCGHDRPGQHTTAADIVRLAQAVAARADLMRLAAMPKATVRTVDNKRSFRLANTNALLGYTGVLGLKTGYTPEAGRCIVGLAERDGVRVLLVILNGSDRWWDAAAMIERAFAFR
ncbi:MAG TPA: serine hydrolase [Burkholderiales bacterium]|nr:serine hydrolase [Burkholderiales bacterium]